jgi:acyl dehydratase
MGTWSLVAAMLRNIRARQLNRAMLGFTLQEDLGPIAAVEALAYARATADTNPRYEGAQAVLPPFFVSKLVFPLVERVLVHPQLHMNLLRMVHGEMSVRWHQPLHPGDNLHTSLRLDQVVDTPAGELLQMAGRAEVNSRLAAETTVGLLVRRRAKGPKEKREETATPPEVFRLDLRTWDGQERQYAQVSGDRNFIHTSTLLARLAGLPRTVLHGVCVMAMACAALTDKLAAGDIGRLQAIRGRFSQLVLPGETLTLRAFESERPGEVPFAVFTAAGKPAIKNGLIEIA